jgi:alpha-ketoglutarate-dependent 2,4-dichlorophenoxyacetate dioxygenase
VPKQISTGDRTILGKISKRGNRYTHTWAVSDLIIWDNRCTLHRGRPYDERNHRRDMRRATIQDLDPAAQDLSAA